MTLPKFFTVQQYHKAYKRYSWQIFLCLTLLTLQSCGTGNPTRITAGDDRAYVTYLGTVDKHHPYQCVVEGFNGKIIFNTLVKRFEFPTGKNILEVEVLLQHKGNPRQANISLPVNLLNDKQYSVACDVRSSESVGVWLVDNATQQIVSDIVEKPHKPFEPHNTDYIDAIIMMNMP